MDELPAQGGCARRFGGARLLDSLVRQDRALPQPRYPGEVEKCLEKLVEKFDTQPSDGEDSPRAATTEEATARTKAPKEEKAGKQVASAASTRGAEPAGSEVFVSEGSATSGTISDGGSVSDRSDRSRDSDDGSDEPREPREPKEPKGTRSR